jgi:carboxyl-terminal processing protease
VKRSYGLKWIAVWVGIAVALALTFTCGMVAHQLLGDGGWMLLGAHVAQVVPGVFERETAPDIPLATNLDPIQTFWKARHRVMTNYVYPDEIDEVQLTYGAIKGMLAALGDPYTRFMTPDDYNAFRTESEGHFDGIGAVLDDRINQETEQHEVFIQQVLPNGPAHDTELREQDVIVAVDRKLVKTLSLTDVVHLIRGKGGTKVVLTVSREGEDKVLDIEIVRGRVDMPIVEFELLDNDIGYMWLQQFNRQAEKEVQEGLNALKGQGMKALLLDLSSNPGGMLDMAVAIASLFLDDTPITWIADRAGEPEPIEARGGIMLDEDVPMVVLIDGNSASASEIVAGALQDTGRATIVGHPSYGKAKVQTVMELDDGSALVLTTAVYLTPNKRDISKPETRGVQPDVRLPDPPERLDTQTREEYSQAYEQWRQDQIARAAELLREKLAARPAG